jgi:hypothetical protein
MDRNERGMNELKYLPAWVVLHVQIVGDLHWNESKEKNILEFRGATLQLEVSFLLCLGV